MTCCYSFTTQATHPAPSLSHICISFLLSHFTVKPPGAYPNLNLGLRSKAVHSLPELSCELLSFPPAPYPLLVCCLPPSPRPKLWIRILTWSIIDTSKYICVESNSFIAWLTFTNQPQSSSLKSLNIRWSETFQGFNRKQLNLKINSKLHR